MTSLLPINSVHTPDLSQNAAMAPEPHPISTTLLTIYNGSRRFPLHSHIWLRSQSQIPITFYELVGLYVLISLARWAAGFLARREGRCLVVNNPSDKQLLELKGRFKSCFCRLYLVQAISTITHTNSHSIRLNAASSAVMCPPLQRDTGGRFRGCRHEH